MIRSSSGTTGNADNEREPADPRARLAAIVDSSDDAIIGKTLDGVITSWNRGAELLYGYSAAEAIGQPISLIIPPERRDELPHLLQRLARGERIDHYETVRCNRDGLRLMVSVTLSPVKDASERIVGASAIARDISSRAQAEALIASQKHILEMMIAGAPLARVLEELTRAAEELAGAPLLASILLLDPDGVHLRHGAAPSLPVDYIRAMDGIAIGPRVGSCGTAAYRGQLVVVADIATDPLWQDFRDLALGHGLRACWSTPIRPAGGPVLGTFALYYREPRAPTSREQEAVGLLAHTAALAIERGRTAATVRESEGRFQAVWDGAADAMALSDPDGMVLAANPAYCELYAYPPEEVVGHSFAVIFPDEVRAWAVAEYRRVFEQDGVTPSVESVVRRRDGTERTVQVNYTFLMKDGRRAAMLSIIRDITPIKQAEIEREWLLAQEQAARAEADAERARLREIFQQAPAAIAVLEGPEHTIRVANPLFLEMTGRPRNLIGLTVRDALPEIGGQGYFELLDQVYASGEPFVGTESPVWIGGSGSIALMEIFATFVYQPIRDVAGKVSGILIHAVDVTAQVQARRQVEEIAARLQLAQDAARIGTFEWHIPENRVIWTPELEALHGLPAGGFEGTHDGWRERIHLDDVADADAAVQRAFATGDLDTEWRVVWPDGTVRWIHAKGRTFSDSAGAAVRMVGVNLDITARKSAEAERERLLTLEQTARQEAEAANRAKDEFLSVLSHELRTPLTPILGYTAMLRRKPVSGAQLTSALEAIERSARTQARLVEDLLDVSRIVTGKLLLTTAPSALQPVIDAAVAAVHLSASAKQVAITIDLDPTEIVVAGDADRLQQVVWNLVANAVKFTPAGGEVDVRLTHDGRDAVITVSDTGIGIAPDFLPQIFDRFRQADPASTRMYGGLGLGLAIVRHVVELHGGTVEATSAGEGQGTTFTVRLPLLMPSFVGRTVSAAEPRPHEAPAATPLIGARLLLLEDDPDTRAMLRLLLEQAGAEVTITATSAEALTALDNARPDALVADIGLPDEDGYTFISRVRARPAPAGGRIPALALTAYAGDEDQQRALTAGFARRLSKPVDPETLISALIALIRRP